MNDPPSVFRAFLGELKRRRVYRVAVVYAAVAFVIWQAAEITFPALNLPPWTLTFVVVLTLLGFPIALVLAWAFDITPEGVKRARPSAGEPAPAARPGMTRLATAGLAVVVLVVAAGWFLLAERAAREAPGGHFVAVLPFDNLSADAENDYFSDGITDDIITQLSKVADITVTSRTSSMRYKGSEVGIQQIAEELGVATILEGGVQRVGDRVHINAQLIDAMTDRHLWAETYDEELTASNIFEVQVRIARSIAEALDATLSAKEEERLGRKPTENLAAYDLFLLGRNQWQGGYSLESIRRSIDYFECAIEEDPGYARAYAGLAHAYAALGYWGFPDAPPPRQSFRQAREAVTRALEIDDELAEGHTTLATLHWRDDFQILEAETEIRRAIELSPDDPLAHQEYGLVLSMLGRYDESIEEMRRARGGLIRSLRNAGRLWRGRCMRPDSTMKAQNCLGRRSRSTPTSRMATSISGLPTVSRAWLTKRFGSWKEVWHYQAAASSRSLRWDTRMA